ncbi:hypothetical protein DPMN_146800 [Dreissena polymorpha]|uniref:Fibrinogen C-terminal domain-containing protein n=1 Tax=Dreissena polymorpha TaxID=45954 RepID=A0A9D4J2F0_DREPO|nr:hypothetical protein DPMN_146800 [Dreissena polymorpha]
MLVYVLYYVLIQTVDSQLLSEISAKTILKRLERLESDAFTIRKDLNEENELLREDISSLSNRLSELSGHDKEPVAIAPHGSSDFDAIVSQYENLMNAFKREKSENIILRKKFDKMRKEHDFEIGNLREMFNIALSGLNSTDRILRSEIDTIKHETIENALRREHSEKIMLQKKFDEMRKEHDLEIGNLREMFNNIISVLKSTDRTLRSEVDTIKNETTVNLGAAQKLVHDSYVVCQKEINDTRAYFNDVLLRNKFDEIRKERDFEIENVRKMFNNVVSILNSTDWALHLEIYTHTNETKANMSAVQKLVHDSYAVCQKEINDTRAYFKNGLLLVNESLMDRSLSSSQKITRIISDIVNLKTSNDHLKTVTDNFIKLQRHHPHSCDFVKDSGIYTIYPSSHPNGIKVYCYKESTNKGWIVIQRRADGSVNFNRTWADYKSGFDNVSGEFWLGNENIYQLTKDEPRELRIDMETFNGTKRYALYSKFSISSESEKYKLHVDGYSGNADDDLAHHNGQSFSTVDADNDKDRICCACTFGGGGWWYITCHPVNLNGKYFQRNDKVIMGNGIHWGSLTHFTKSLKFVEMKIR